MDIQVSSHPAFSMGPTFYAIAGALPALSVFIALFGVARARRASPPSMVPGWLAAAALAPVIATLFAVRVIIQAVQGTPIGGGGIAAASAGMLEATQPLVWTSYFACILALVTLFLALRQPHAGEPETSSRGTVVAIIAIVTAFVAVASTAALFHQTSRLLVEMVDPPVVRSLPLSRALARIGESRLVLTGATALLMTALLVAAIVVTALTARSARPRPGIARALVVLSAVAAVGFAASGLVHRAWAAKLHEAAMTGKFPRAPAPR